MPQLLVIFPQFIILEKVSTDLWGAHITNKKCFMEIMQTHHTDEKGNYVSLKSSHITSTHHITKKMEMKKCFSVGWLHFVRYDISDASF